MRISPSQYGAYVATCVQQGKRASVRDAALAYLLPALQKLQAGAESAGPAVVRAVEAQPPIRLLSALKNMNKVKTLLSPESSNGV